MIDLHCHVLPGIDDGPGTIEDSVALARAAAAMGTQTIVATPHVSSRYPNDAGTIERLVEALNLRLARESIDITIAKGAEIAMTHLAELDRQSLLHMRLGDGPWLLIEPPFSPVAPGLESIVTDLMQDEYKVIIAHPERCAALQRNPAVVERLVDAGALCSITAASLTGDFGSQARDLARHLMRQELVHNVASDAHDAYRRPPALATALKRAEIGELATWLVHTVPAAILAGDPIPARPRAPQGVSAQRGLLTRLRRS